MVVEYSFRVKWGNTDAAGIVFYPNFYKWMDEATHEYFTAIAFPSSTLFVEQQVGTPLLEANCQFKSPLFFEDQVTVRSVVVELHQKVFKISHTFLRNEKLIAEGFEIRAWTSFKEKPKAYPIPDQVREKMMPKETLNR
ncbi:acyl-CoA thioesterase [Halalkalibacter krulwichiae]|uniref:4-hydroxybenzoyl-CoA thioesterase n=1 Tax=Halalkalibacter krulwichiae TaxID=199441 RepID=A0A1X9MMU2_9BACI|nr:thioesterase family protein [Halalkalibacter krulwichiae]ARK32572.1 4-hydroxybenzoyl-CoA thioesterase [Halalkalibacter krulwichiae]